MYKRLIICSREKEYSMRLAEHISNRKELLLQIGICTSFQKLLDLEEKQKIDILIISASIPYEKRVSSKAPIKFVLTKGNQAKLDDREKEIFQYQSAAAIIDQLIAGCMEDNEDSSQTFFKSVNSHHKELIGVYSPIHRIGKSKFTIELARALSQRKELLYLNLEEYPALIRGSEENQPTLADVLCYLKQECNAGMRITASVTRYHEVDTILPIPISKDLREVSLLDWQLLIQTLLKESIYEIIVIDFGEVIQGLFSLLELCDVIYMPEVEEESALRKVALYRQTLKEIGQENILAKTVTVKMQEDRAECVKGVLRLRGQKNHHDTTRTVI